MLRRHHCSDGVHSSWTGSSLMVDTAGGKWGSTFLMDIVGGLGTTFLLVIVGGKSDPLFW